MSNVVNFLGNHFVELGAAVVTAVIIAWATKHLGAREEVAKNDRRAGEINEELRRWVKVRGNELDLEVGEAENPMGWHDNDSRRTRAERRVPLAMKTALGAYRDEAVRTVGDFSALARGESTWHQWTRWRRRYAFPSLGLNEDERRTLDGWRRRPSGPTIVPATDFRVDDDPTANEPGIAPLETEAGLTWKQARKGVAR